MGSTQSKSTSKNHEKTTLQKRNDRKKRQKNRETKNRRTPLITAKPEDGFDEPTKSHDKIENSRKNENEEPQHRTHKAFHGSSREYSSSREKKSDGSDKHGKNHHTNEHSQRAGYRNSHHRTREESHGSSQEHSSSREIKPDGFEKPGKNHHKTENSHKTGNENSHHRIHEESTRNSQAYSSNREKNSDDFEEHNHKTENSHTTTNRSSHHKTRKESQENNRRHSGSKKKRPGEEVADSPEENGVQDTQESNIKPVEGNQVNASMRSQCWEQRHGNAAQETTKNKNQEDERAKRRQNGRTQQKSKITHKQQREMVEKERKMQRVTKEQLRNLSSTLHRTSWYLGRRLGLTEEQIRRISSNFATEYERKYQTLLWWRRSRGWKATVQKLVILLELADYTYEEYKSIVMTSNDADVIIYDKAPNLPQVNHPSNGNNNAKKEFYQDDKHEVIKHHGHSYGNMNYDDIMPAEETNHKSSSKDAGHRDKHNRTKEKRRDKETSDRDRSYRTLPPVWKEPETRISVEEERIYDEVPRESASPDQTPAPSITGAEHPKSTENQANRGRNHSNESNTDDSGILTSSCATSPKLRTDLKAFNMPDSTTETEIKGVYVKEISSEDRKTRGSSQTVLVRRCSDSAVKLTYATNLREKMEAVKTVEPPIKEYESAEELEEIFAKSVAEDSNNASRVNHGDVTQKQSRPTQHHNTINNGKSEITNGSFKKGVQGMVRKYETLTRLHHAQNRDSMTSEGRLDRNYFAASTLPRNYAAPQAPRASRFTSQTSLQSIGSHDAINGRYARHSSSKDDMREYLPRYSHFKFGGRGKHPSRFKGLISGIGVLPNGDIVASDSDNKRVQIFDRKGKFQTAFDSGTELKPKGLCITPNKNIAVCCGNEVHVYDRDGIKHLSFGQGVFRNNCYCVCCDTDSNYYVTDIVSHTISVHDPRGRIRKRFGFQGTGMVNFNQPVSLAVNSKKHLHITDSQNHCIKVYTLAGRPLYRIGAKGSSDGLFWNPLGLCIDDKDHLFVADCGNNRISEFSPSGNFMRHVLTAADGLWMPSLVQTTVRGQLIICEWEKQYVKVFNIETEV